MGPETFPRRVYSKGMKNRLTFARSLIHDPEIYFFDEPSQSLDPVNAEKIVQIIQKKKDEGRTIFLTTHNMNIADILCDRIAFIVDGEIKTMDTPKTLKQAHGEKKVAIEYVNGKLQREVFELENLADNKEFLDLLRKKEVLTIHSQEASLDKVFIKVTGRELT